MLLFWPLLGAAIGAYAAQKRGFSTLGGVIGGLLLGPLAFLLFFVTGVTSANEQRKCPYCAEWIRPEARVCKHCRRDVPPSEVAAAAPSRMSPVLKGVLIIAALFFGLIAFLLISAQSPSMSILPGRAPTVTMNEFARLHTGMTYQQAMETIGTPGSEISRNEIAGISTVMYGWNNSDGSNMNAMFQNGELIQKSQFGLK
jgi:hypothetical protein